MISGETLEHRLLRDYGADYDLLEVVAIPSGSDRSIQMSLLEKALRDFDGESDSQELQQYLIQLRPRKKPVFTSKEREHKESKESAEQIYFPDGTLNAPFLMQNAQLLLGCEEYTLARNIYLRIPASRVPRRPSPLRVYPEITSLTWRANPHCPLMA